MEYNILVVDDTEANRYVLSRCLTQAGYRVVEAANGAQALEHVRSKPDLVILDIKLPDMDGYEVCRRIKSDPNTRSVLVLNISASFIGSEARVAGLDNGADSYLVQPMETTEFLATVRSLLRLRDAERLAVHREARYRALVEASSQAVWALDQRGGLVEEFGLGDLLGRPPQAEAPCGWLDGFIAEDRERLRNGWLVALAAELPWEQSGRLRAADGTIRHLRLRVVPWRERPDRPAAEWIGSASDATALAETDRQLADKVEQLARSNQYLQHFAYVLSHDLQEPLRTITNYLDLIRKRAGGGADDQTERYFGYVTDAAKRMRHLITGVLQYSTVTRSPERRWIELRDALGEALANLTPLIDGKHARIFADELPGIHGDRTQIVQLFQNLISNSLKYCPDRPPEIRIAATSADGFHRISITDNGIGMEPQHLDKVFELFSRLHSHDSYEGTGIGLALCQRIVEHHGGRIWAESRPGAGSTFRFTLPIGRNPVP